MKGRFIILAALFTVLLISNGCLSPENINKKIAETYRGLDSISYEVTILRTDTYDKVYTAYIFKRIDELPFIELGESKELSGASFKWNSKVFIQKPDKKIVFTSGSHSAFVSGGQLIENKWYFKFEPEGVEPETQEECKELEPFPQKKGDEPRVEGPKDKCIREVENSIISVPSELDNPEKFKVETIEEIVDGIVSIKATIESATAEPFEIGNIGGGLQGLKFDKIIFWFAKDDLKPIRIVGKQIKKKAGSEDELGLTTIYTFYFDNVILNPIKIEGKIKKSTATGASTGTGAHRTACKSSYRLVIYDPEYDYREVKDVIDCSRLSSLDGTQKCKCVQEDYRIFNAVCATPDGKICPYK